MTRKDSNQLYYQTHRDAILKKTKTYQKEKRDQISAYRKARRLERMTKYYQLKSDPCKDCGGKFHPWQMEFDHLRDKRFNVSSLIGNGNKWEAVLKEIAKCDLVCANCHNHRTHLRRHQDLQAS